LIAQVVVNPIPHATMPAPEVHVVFSILIYIYMNNSTMLE